MTTCEPKKEIVHNTQRLVQNILQDLQREGKRFLYFVIVFLLGFFTHAYFFGSSERQVDHICNFGPIEVTCDNTTPLTELLPVTGG